MLAGRKYELKLPNEAYRSENGELVPVRLALRKVTHR